MRLHLRFKKCVIYNQSASRRILFENINITFCVNLYQVRNKVGNGVENDLNESKSNEVKNNAEKIVANLHN